MALRPPVSSSPPQGGQITVTTRPPPATAVRSNSRQGPFIDLKGIAKTFVKTNTAIGQVKALIGQYKSIHNIGDVVSAVKNTAALAKKFGLFGGKLKAKGSIVKRYGESDHPISTNPNITTRNTRTFNVNDFIAKANANSFAKACRFNVIFTPPANILTKVGGIMSNVKLMCDAAEFPGRSFNTTDARIYGATFKSPNLSVYNEVNFTILCDQNLNEKFIFDFWMDYINPIYDGTTKRPAGGFDFEYRDNYTQMVQIIQYSDNGDPTYICELMEAYPIAVAPLTTDWSNDQYHKVQVTMCYRYWREKSPKLLEPNNGSSIIPSASSRTISGALAGLGDEIISTKSNLSLPSSGRLDSLTSKAVGGLPKF